MKNKINIELLDNIEISDEMKESLYRNCKSRRRTADFAFRYSGVLSVLIGASVFFALSIGVTAAAITVKQRLEDMSDTEYQSYEQEVDNDTYVAYTDGPIAPDQSEKLLSLRQ